MNQSPSVLNAEKWSSLFADPHATGQVCAVNAFLLDRFCIIITLHFVANLHTFCFSILYASYFNAL